jgi:acyl-[acyl-carrier-protein]-phospholipid O-acyltransferase/long-chain-fatty-acid--[acyl-carrier-protein] ligase
MENQKTLTGKKSWLKQQSDRFLKFALLQTFKILFGMTVKGVENFDKIKGEPTLIVANHTSLLDGALLAAILPVKPSFAIDLGVYNRMKKNPLIGFIFSHMDMHPLDMNNPQAIRDLTRLAEKGKPVMIFPEGRLTTTGSIMQIFDGASSVADNAKAHIVPVYMDGLQFLGFGATRAKAYPDNLLPRLSVTVMEPRTLELPDDLKGKLRRAERLQQMETIMHELPVKAVDTEKNLMSALRYAVRHFGAKYAILDDVDGSTTTYGEVLTGAHAIGNALAKITKPDENVGFLLPNSGKSAVVFWGMQAAGRVPAMLNASSDAPTMLSCAETAQLKTIVTSRKFVEMAKLEGKMEALAQGRNIVYLEDMRTKIGFFDKAKAYLQAKGLWVRSKDEKTGSDPAVVIFTSGSEGAPKGVVLSSYNILSNIAQMNSVMAVSPDDKVFNAMPIFHSFGLSGGMITPMLKGMRSLQYPTPLDSKNIPRSVYFYDATVMFGTDTFLSMYARSAKNADLASLRKGMVFAGAEALAESTYNTYVDRFGVRILQGYGMTEAAPAVSINVPYAHSKGTVGKILPCIETRLDAVEGMDGAKLSIKGPNIMLGYLMHDKIGLLQAPKDGWHDTGDIVSFNQDGFMSLVGRAKRFAKIGGEMVSLQTIETLAKTAAPEKEHGAILVQTAEKGDSIVLFTTDSTLQRDALSKVAKDENRSMLGVPKNNEIFFIEAIPKLPTGKTDYVSLKKEYMARQEALSAGTSFNISGADTRIVSGVDTPLPVNENTIVSVIPETAVKRKP